MIPRIPCPPATILGCAIPGSFHQTHPVPCTVQIYFVLLTRSGAPGGFELPAFWFVAVRPTLPNLARGVANRTDSATWGKFSQTTFSFICCRLPHFCRRFLQFALHFRDSYQMERNWMSYGQQTRTRPCPEPELAALRTLMIIQGREAFC